MCDSINVEEKLIENQMIIIGGESIKVESANIYRCNNCSIVFYCPEEITQWAAYVRG